jgi:hypothetical protein
VVHAAGESVIFRVPPETHAVVLAAKSEDELLKLEQKLLDMGIPHRAIREPDAPWNGQLMSIGLIPSKKTDAIKKCLSNYPLLR